MQLRFEGASDDTFGETLQFCDDHDNCASGRPIAYRVTAPDGQALVVVGQYAPSPCGGWLVGVSTWDPESRDVPLPDWPMHLMRGRVPYSPTLLIDVPDGTTIACLSRAAE